MSDSISPEDNELSASDLAGSSNDLTNDRTERTEENNDDEEMTPADVLKKLEEVRALPENTVPRLLWRNEGDAPELLPHRYEIVDSVLDQIENMDKNLATAGRQRSRNALRNDVALLELDRIKYVLSSYLRRRLRKIEKYVFFCLESDKKSTKDGYDGRMTPQETEFAKNYAGLLRNHLESNVLDQLPPVVTATSSFTFDTTAPQPNTDHFVFVRIGPSASCDVTVSSVVDGVRQDELVELEPNTQHLLPYKAVADLVANGSAVLL